MLESKISQAYYSSKIMPGIADLLIVGFLSELIQTELIVALEFYIESRDTCLRSPACVEANCGLKLQYHADTGYLL